MKLSTEKEYYTFSTNGLNDNQISFLAAIEDLYFEGEDIYIKNPKVRAIIADHTKGNDLFEAWDYWTSQKFVADRQSLKVPVCLSSIFSAISRDKKYNSFWVQNDNGSYYAEINRDYFNNLDLQLIYELTPDNFYFKEMTDGRLFLEYQQIIGSRFIAQTC